MEQWPACLDGDQIIEFIVLTGRHRLRRRTVEELICDLAAFRVRTATLKLIHIEGLTFNEGLVELGMVIEYNSLSTTPPPILVEGTLILDGNHRTMLARSRGESQIWAYVLD